MTDSFNKSEYLFHKKNPKMTKNDIDPKIIIKIINIAQCSNR